MSKIKIYKGEVTAGGTNGTVVSSGTNLAPIESGSIKVPAEGYQTGEWIKLALRCDGANPPDAPDGYQTQLDGGKHAQITIEGPTPAKKERWQLALDDEGDAGTPEDWGDPISFLSVIGTKNVLFWARARASYEDEPAKDRAVQLKVMATIEAI